jgi:mannosyltransferase OCH1-like enzyme
MIPKVIHYCWFGGKPLPELAKKCIASWKKKCPDYEIKEWNETNFDLSSNRYLQEAIKMKKWAFASDYIRLAVLYNEGGIYLDTDVEILKPLDKFLRHDFFTNFENLAMISQAENLQLQRANLRSYDARLTETGILIARSYVSVKSKKKGKKK